MINVLFLCTGNSARSILAEAILNHLGGDRFVGHSAGSQPKGIPHPDALTLLKRFDLPTGALRSKSWDEFAGAKAPQLDVIITVCDNAADEVCPIWPGHPLSVHWGLPDPAALADADERADLFLDVYNRLTRMIEVAISLPFNSADAQSLKMSLKEIGTTQGTYDSGRRFH